MTPEVGKATEALKKGKVDFKADEQGIVHQILGKMSFPEEQLQENVQVFMENLKKSKPETAKGEFILSTTLTSSMGPGIKLKR